VLYIQISSHSGNKARFKDQELGLELDLVYLTDHVSCKGPHILLDSYILLKDNHHGLSSCWSGGVLS
jgi:hypothetical protein